MHTSTADFNKTLQRTCVLKDLCYRVKAKEVSSLVLYLSDHVSPDNAVISTLQVTRGSGHAYT